MKQTVRILEINKIVHLSCVIFTFTLLNAACFSATSTTVNSTEVRIRLNKGSITLAGEFLYQLVSSKPNQNSVASATSLLIPLAQLALWATGAVLQELLKVLNLKSKDEIKSVFPQLTTEFGNQTDVEFEVATKYYANIGFPLSQNFITDSKKYFDAEGENINFSENEQAAKTINDWVSNKTRGKIQDLVQPSMFSGDTRLCLVNAIYFLGNWVYQFNPNDTQTKDFYKSNGDTVPLKMMYQQNTFNYAENNQFQALEMFYDGNKFSFLVILPREIDGLLETVKTLRDPDVFTNVMQSLREQKVQVSFPKMLIETQIDIRELLIKDNVTSMFDPRNDGFDGILAEKEPVYVSDAVQKAYVAVDEKGTEAAAATGKSVFAILALPPIIFNANRPFIYYIISRQIPLFTGTFVGAK